MQVSRSNLMQKPSSPEPALYCKADDEQIMALIKEVIKERPSYGYRRVTALINKQLAARGEKLVNHKRIFRLMSRSHLYCKSLQEGQAEPIQVK